MAGAGELGDPEGDRLAAGGAATLALSSVLDRLLYGVRAGDPFRLAGAFAFLTFVAVSACAVPAIGAMRIDPIAALRDE